MWKKILAVAGAVLAFIVAAFISGRLSNRRGDDGDNRARDQATEHADNAIAANRAAGSALADSLDGIREINTGNRDAQDDASAILDILRRASNRAKAKDDNLGGDNGP